MRSIEILNVSKIYRIGEIETHALKNINLELAEGEFSALVGPSGSGKTTLLQLLGCLDRPDGGSIVFDGQDVTQLDADKRADLRKEMIGFIFQFFALIPVLSAFENIELPLLLNGFGQAERKQRVDEMLEAVGLCHRANHRPNQMSGGEQQRVAIARALSTKPLIILADEPTANLDTENGAQAMEIMHNINQKFGTAFLFATHDPRVVAYARREIRMRDGMIEKA